ncbi:unnamed protein product [Durusdinium trenchii]|uniref:Uncharacterized protein n=1 Tax=Durusdinium trenchii TaxID=1381693 RepID=A0ABP0KJF9_9DINO
MSNILPHVVPLRSFTVILPAASQIHRQDGQGARQFGTSRKGEESDAKNGQGGEEEGWKCLAEVSKAEVATSRWRVTVNRGAWPGSPCKSELEPWVTPQSFASKEPPVFMWASRCRRAVLLVDGKETLKEVRFRFELLGKDSSAAPDVLAVGQKVEEEVVLAHAGPGFKVKGYHNYRLNFLEKERWLDVSVQKSWPSAAEDKLRVANNTTVMPLAKAVAARQKALPEGGALLLETTLLGTQDQKRLRVSHLAQAVARAYAWQVRPVDPSLPVRLFHCTGWLRRQGPDAPLLQLVILPEGRPCNE